MTSLATSYLSTFTLQGAIGLAVSLACLILWLAFRRQAAAAWTITWVVLATSQFLALVAVQSHVDVPLGVVTRVCWTASLAGFFVVNYLSVVATADLVGSARARVPHWGILLALALMGAVMAQLGLQRAAVSGGNFVETGAVGVRSLNVVGALLSLHLLRRADAWREDVGLRLLAAAFVGVILRAVVSMVLSIWFEHGLAIKSGPVLLVAFQVVVQVFWGTASTLAVLESARRDALGAERRANELERQLLNAQRVESIGQVASGVAHDFNNVLTVIRQSAQMALDPAVTRREVEQDLREIVAASERGSALTRQLLNFARGAPEDVTACDLNDRIRALLPMLQRLASHAVSIELRLSPDTPMARIDGTQFDQLVVNFVTNARDAMPAGGRITISTARVAESPSVPGGPRRPVPAALLTVSDQGSGIPEELQQRIFEPFFTTKAQERGTGLGLTTCASVVRRAGGVIELTSTPTRGTTFDVYLPPA